MNPLIIFLIFNSVRSVKGSVNEKKRPLCWKFQVFDDFLAGPTSIAGWQLVKIRK